MNSDVRFQTHLRREVDTAGKHFEKARDQVAALIPGPDIEPGPKLLEATQLLAASLHVYICALRRLASHAAHQDRQQAA